MKRFLPALALLAGIAPACAQNVSIPNLPQVTIPADSDLFILEHVAGPAGQHTSRLLASDLANYVNSRLALTAGLTNETARAVAAEGALTTNLTAETTRATAAEALKAPLASPALTGTPTAPTATGGTATTQIATTAFDAAAITVETTRATTAEGTKITGPLTGDVTTSGAGAATTLATSGVTAGSYGSSTTVPVLTVDAKGRITAASTAAAAGTGTVTSVTTGTGLSGGPITSTGTVTAADNLMQGRLTLSTGTPVMTATVSAATAVLYTPYTGNLVGVWNGSTFVEIAFSEYSQALSDTTYSPTAGAASQCYDDFAWNSSGTVRVTRGPTWATGGGSNTARGTGSGSTALSRVNGVLTNQYAITNGPAAGYGTYVGTFCTDSGGATVSWGLGGAASGGTAATLNIWNMYNRVIVSVSVLDTSSWSYTSASLRSADNSNSNRISAVFGQQEITSVVNYTTNGIANVGYSLKAAIGLDSTSSYSGRVGQTANLASGTAIDSDATGTYTGYVGLGLHYFQALESGAAGGTFYGYANSQNSSQLSAMIGGDVMPFNGSGFFQRVYSWVSDAANPSLDYTSPSRMDADANDLAAGLSNTITRDGQGVPTADIPWGNHKITGLKAPTNPGDVLSLGSTPSSEITAILGSAPWTAANLVAPWNAANLTAAQLNTIAAVGQIWGTSNLTAGQIAAILGVGTILGTSNLTAAEINALAGQTLYGSSNLTAAAIAAILGGYYPTLDRNGYQAYIGFDGTNPDVQILSTYYGALWTSVKTAYYGAQTGYIKFVNGLTLQWGIAGAGADFAVSFPMAFSSSCFMVTATLNGAPGSTTVISCSVDTLATTYFNARPRYIQYGSGAGIASQNVNWFAIGV